VKAFGEFEFWFASIKVVAIVVFLFVGALFITGSLPNSIPTLGFLTSNGGFMPHGWGPVLSGAVAATAFTRGPRSSPSPPPKRRTRPRPSPAPPIPSSPAC
jgi:GABA permease